MVKQEVRVIRMFSSYHDHLVIFDFSDKLCLFAIPLLDVDQLVSLQSHCGLKDKRQECLLTSEEDNHCLKNWPNVNLFYFFEV